MRITATAPLSMLLGGLVFLGGTISAQSPSTRTTTDEASCRDLSSLSVANATIASAQVIPAGKFKLPADARAGYSDLPAFCRVELTLKPSSDSDIKSEVWLPMSGWN
jgi:hypothetical protein